MGHSSDVRLLAMHGLRLRGFAEPDAVAEVVGLDAATVASVLEDLKASELAIYRDGRMTGYMLTPTGRAEHESMLAAELDESGCRDQVQNAYERFLGLNHELLSICTAWQMREVNGAPAPNDHADPTYDQKVIGNLVSLHDKVRPICADLRDALDRFGGYSGRLRDALEHLLNGDRDYFTKPMFPSYHTVWFEMHEDLLATLGIDRSTEGAHE
jgi:hypothetical protein